MVTKREQSIYLEALQALKRRTPPEHPILVLVKEKLGRYLAGYRGECAVDYQLSYLSEKDYTIFRGIRLYDGKHYFQIDTLLVSQKFLLIIETKNLAGEITFDEKNHQLIQEIEGTKKAYQDPLIQIYFQEHNLRSWLSLHGFPELPIFSLVVISNPKTILRTTSMKVIRNEFLSIKINQIEKNYPEIHLPEKTFKKLTRQLKKSNTPLHISILDQFQIKKEELLTGVHCPKCSFLPLIRAHGSWHCPKCHSKHQDAHLTSIKDYCLLINDHFTNKEIRNFLNITNPQLINRLLTIPQFAQKGNTKARIYNFLN